MHKKIIQKKKRGVRTQKRLGFLNPKTFFIGDYFQKFGTAFDTHRKKERERERERKKAVDRDDCPSSRENEERDEEERG